MEDILCPCNSCFRIVSLMVLELFIAFLKHPVLNFSGLPGFSGSSVFGFFQGLPGFSGSSVLNFLGCQAFSWFFLFWSSSHLWLSGFFQQRNVAQQSWFGLPVCCFLFFHGVFPFVFSGSSRALAFRA